MDDRADGSDSCDRYEAGMAVMSTDWIESGGTSTLRDGLSGPLVTEGMLKLPVVLLLPKSSDESVALDKSAVSVRYGL